MKIPSFTGDLFIGQRSVRIPAGSIIVHMKPVLRHHDSLDSRTVALPDGTSCEATP